MATIRFVSGQEREFVPAERLEGDPGKIEEQGRQGQVALFMRHPGTDVEPQLMEVRFAPGAEASAHAHEVDEMVRQIRSNSGGVVLAAAHSDSTVTILQSLVPGFVDTIELDDFDNLYVVSFDGAGGVRLVRMQYGASTPSSGP